MYKGAAKLGTAILETGNTAVGVKNIGNNSAEERQLEIYRKEQRSVQRFCKLQQESTLKYTEH
jgi:hypothetical protein